MSMGFKKKKNIIILSLCMIISFILYQLYFFMSITSETDNTKISLSGSYTKLRDFAPLQLLRSEADKFVNTNGVLRGVLYFNMPKYRPNKNNEFKCLTVDKVIPFEQVNDDYCDCEDSSDEPSTSACVNGTFYCDTQYRSRSVVLNSVPSGQVNDGVCDCCDGSDEWLHHSKLLSQSSGHQRHYVTQCINECVH